MRDVDFDPKKFARDEYGNLYKKNKPGQVKNKGKSSKGIGGRSGDVGV